MHKEKIVSKLGVLFMQEPTIIAISPFTNTRNGVMIWSRRGGWLIIHTHLLSQCSRLAKKV